MKHLGRIITTQRGTDDLLELLDEVESKFKKYDDYIRYELCSTKVNLKIENLGEEYINDPTVQIIVPKINGLNIPDCILDVPYDKQKMWQIPILKLPSYYPNVTYDEENIIISEELESLKHGIPQYLFTDPLRITITDECDVEEIIVTCKIFGQNLPKPIEKELQIIISR